MSSHHHAPARRAISAAALITASAAVLTGCSLLPSGGSDAKAVDFDDVQSATVYFKGQGTYIMPGTTSSSEVAWIGSGFLIDENGLAVTNNHVVVGAGTLSGFIGGDPDEEVGVKVLGASECLDLAVVQLDGAGFPFLGWHKGEIKSGLDVYSAGYPLGAAEEFTLTRGIVSKNDFPFDTQWASLGHVIEHDARIRGGNSGGPLVDAQGAVVGVNYAGDDSLDYNFAIHRDVALDVVDELAKGERISSIGINAKAWVSEDGSLAGVWVQSVEAGGPADVAGVEPGDLIYTFGGVSVGTDGTLRDYCKVLDTQGADATIDLEVYRPTADAVLSGQVNGKELEVTATNVLGGDTTTTSGGFSTVADDTGTVSMSVPSEWRDVDGSSVTGGDGRTWYSVAASSDLAGFQSSFTTSGAQLVATEGSLSAADALAMFDFSSQCSVVTASGAYDDGYYAGVYNEFDCAGTYELVLATQDTGGVGTVVLIAQLNSDYEKDAVLSQLLNTFQLG
ncbi:serine protease [Protaetiibacter sp. SSC-01]|uniref:S1C family serine protease n=1 Tax=Protaetiibacter sp. SSC-01 TaxID=2759943 RepID=UPI001656E6C0|nr:S1C family serine protease [Protaetiibacter sp. SSC-01]QNO38445.1 serine protease [Protaetiibacter sp. SSC-01]